MTSPLFMSELLLTETAEMHSGDGGGAAVKTMESITMASLTWDVMYGEDRDGGRGNPGAASEALTADVRMGGRGGRGDGEDGGGGAETIS
jgi:hypothetical protein